MKGMWRDLWRFIVRRVDNGTVERWIYTFLEPTPFFVGFIVMFIVAFWCVPFNVPLSEMTLIWNALVVVSFFYIFGGFACWVLKMRSFSRSQNNKQQSKG